MKKEYKKIDKTQQFVRLSIDETNKLIDAIEDKNLITQRELELILFFIKLIDYTDCTFEITKYTLFAAKKAAECDDNFIRKTLSKLKTNNIIEKKDNNVYMFTCIHYGEMEDTEGEFVKISRFNLCDDLSKNDDFNVSAKEIQILVSLICEMNSIGIVNFDKDKKEYIMKKFDISTRSLAVFTKKMKDLNIWEKLNNKEYKFNTRYFTKLSTFNVKTETEEEKKQIKEHPLLAGFAAATDTKEPTINKFFNK